VCQWRAALKDIGGSRKAIISSREYLFATEAATRLKLWKITEDRTVYLHCSLTGSDAL
jgi:hypothetical protein